MNTKVKKTWVMIFAMMLATLVLYLSTGTYSTSPAFVKALCSASLWIAVLLFPYRYILKNDFSGITRFWIAFIVALTAIALVRSIITPDQYNLGNKWVSLLANDNCVFTLLLPAFILVGCSPSAPRYIKSAGFVYLLVGLFGIVIGKFTIAPMIWFLPIFFFYADFKYKVLFICSVIVAVMASFLGDNPTRTYIVILAFSFACLGLVYVVRSKAIIMAFCITVMVASLVYTIPLLIGDEFSAFNAASNIVLQETSDEDLSMDTRTFLFYEMSEDLTDNHAWILGKGAYSHYYSSYFYYYNQEGGDHYIRLNVEVTFLLMLLRSGILYAAAFYLLLAYAVMRAIIRSKNKFTLSIAVMTAGWFCVTTISSLSGCTFINSAMFILIGCSLSDKWLNLNDKEISRYFKVKSLSSFKPKNENKL